jgi:hypothetical protein
MYYLSQLVKYKRVITLVVVMAFGLLVAGPAAQAATGTLNFGLAYGAETGLGEQDVRTTIAKIINVALSLLGIIALVIVLYGGFKWMTAGGNEESVTEARNIIFAGVIGMAIILSAYAIANFVLEQLYEATKGEEYLETE